MKKIQTQLNENNNVENLEKEVIEYKTSLQKLENQISAITQEITSDNKLNQEIKEIM